MVSLGDAGYELNRRQFGFETIQIRSLITIRFGFQLGYRVNDHNFE